TGPFSLRRCAESRSDCEQTGCVRSWGLFAECGSQANTGTILRGSLQARPAWRSKLQYPNSLDRPRSMLCAAWLEAIGKQRIELTIGSFTVAVNGPRWCARTVAAFTFMAATQVHLAQANHLVTLATYRPPWPTPESAPRN